jgi:hypothetical protein
MNSMQTKKSKDDYIAMKRILRLISGKYETKSHPKGAYIQYDEEGEPYEYFIDGKSVDISTFKNFTVRNRYNQNDKKN